MKCIIIPCFQTYYFTRDDVALPGFAKYFQKNSDEEREHAQKFMEYQVINCVLLLHFFDDSKSMSKHITFILYPLHNRRPSLCDKNFDLLVR